MEVKKRGASPIRPEAMEVKKAKTDGTIIKICAWNVASYRAFMQKNGWPTTWPSSYDIVFLSEIKTKEIVPHDMFKDYHMTIAPATVMGGGYSGVALFSKQKPIKVDIGIGDEELDAEGRLIVADYDQFFFVGAYVPNIGQGFKNKDKRGKWENLLLAKIRQLDEIKPVVYCGDLNVAHNEIDLAKPKENYNKTPGFSQDERDWFTNILQNGFKDTFRELHPGLQKYSFWSYRGGARAKNIGWRLDYILVSDRFLNKVVESSILEGTSGSDHAPVCAELRL